MRGVTGRFAPNAPPPVGSRSLRLSPEWRNGIGPVPWTARYRGAINMNDDDDYRMYGHRDRYRGEDDYAPQGNLYNVGRSHAPVAAGACQDDEANDDEIDGDERITYQARSRNDPVRVTIGTLNRRSALDKYLREELDEEENRRWWGRHEV